MTGVPSTDPGHRSATPVAVATLWSIQCGTRQVGAAPVTVLPTPTIQTISRWGRGLAMSHALPRGALCMRGRDPGPPSCGVRDFHALPDLLNVHARTPTRGSGTVPHYYYHPDTAGRPPPSPRDQGRNPGRQRRAPPSHNVLPTVLDHCTPRFKGKRQLPRPYTHYTAPPYNYKRRGWASFCGG